MGEGRALTKAKVYEHEIEMTAQEILETFASVDSWEDRYQFIIDLGRAIPPIDDKLKIEQNKIHGCQSQVWMVGYLSATQPATVQPAIVQPATVQLVADSDAHIVRGLIALVLAVYQGKTPQEILDYDIEDFFDQIQLRQHLSSGRGNGLREMVKRVKSLATEFLKS